MEFHIEKSLNGERLNGIGKEDMIRITLKERRLNRIPYRRKFEGN